jgi:hypothetical protein
MLHPQERNWSLSEVKRQLNVTRHIGVGHCHFRARFLLNNVKGIYDYMRHFDSHPALIPPMTWERSIAPDGPSTLQVVRTPQGDRLTWSGARDYSDGPYLLYNIYASANEPVDISNPANLVATRYMHTSLTMPAKSAQVATAPAQGITASLQTDAPAKLHYAVTALDRYGNESAPARELGAAASGHYVSAVLLPNDGLYLNTPRQPLDARLLQICDLQGRVVFTCLYKPQISIALLRDGMYILKSVNKKGVTHRLGHFIIKRKD